MNDSIFREYDIRGKVGSEFKIDQVYDLTRAIAFYFMQKNSGVKTVAVGMDGRISSPAIKDMMVQALRDCGLNVIFVGICPSPVLYFALYELPVDAGLMITASHNPKEYNGIKISLGTKTIWGAQIKEIRDLYRAHTLLSLSAKKGALQELPFNDTYIAWLKKHFSSLVGMQLPVAIDCGNAAGGTILPGLIKTMAWKDITLLYPEVDGSYPNHEPDPTVEKNMRDLKNTLATTHASVGIGLDGDCDRMAAMTKSGFLVPGDQLLAVFAKDIVQKYPGTSVVFDIKASLGLIELLEKWGVKPVISPCGHAIIKEQMEKTDARIGGELSCHFFFKDRHFGYDDGIYAMMRLFEIMHKTGKSLDELIKIFPKKYSSPEIRLECPEEKKHMILEYLKDAFQKRTDVQIITIDGIRVTLPYGWGNVRASNTQPVLSMRFEADSADNLVRIKNDFIELLSAYYDKNFLERTITPARGE